ncbi:MAG: GH3 auxin-responsive promoter family protein [Bacteroidetes bacterium]|nr:GH3 auxin-responsive promoter family protein [Bacteroidota bacterium]
MQLLGSILKSTIDLNRKLPKFPRKDAFKVQTNTLTKLLTKAQATAFGEHYNFNALLRSKDIVGDFQKSVPTHDYNSIFQKWWYRAINGEPFVCWPEQVKFFALSSGTSEASSKYIPVTKDMIKAIRKTSMRQILTMSHYNLPKEHFQRGILMLGGSTHLNYNGTYFEGDLSGISTGNLPFWFQYFYKPGRRIAKERDWNSKLDEITKSAKDWDIGVVSGVPAWMQILFERIIAHYKLNNIHEIWPNLLIYAHGGVSFTPYKKGFEKLLGKPMIYLETYLASEGFIAYQERPNSEGMRLVLDNGIFYEFVPFNENNFDGDGNMIQNPETLTVENVKENQEYAILLSTCSGAWRYLIGDTIKFTSLEYGEIVITGRTKHFLSLCGEHLSQDNMNRAIKMVEDELNIVIREFSVAGINYENLFAHKWYIGTDDKVDTSVLKEKIDSNLKALNDDYRVERIAALKDILIEVLPSAVFYDFMRSKGKEGGQNKFPRVLKKNQLTDWEAFLAKLTK